MTGLISRLRIRLLIAAAALALHTAQGQTVSGTVVDRLTREPIVGATVIDAATRKGTVSDIDGRFAISPAALPATLRISFIGYKPQEAVVTDAGRELAVSLEEEVNDLAEMVVVGYGTQRRTQLTGSVTKIKADVFASSPAPTLDGALGGAVAGLNVTAASGQPGAASSIRIRGGNSVNASNEPLYVIDGFIYYKDAGAAKGRYAFSASSAQQDGVIINSGFDRYNLHINADWTLNDVLDFGLSANYGKSTQDGLTTTESVAYNSSPYSAGITNSFVYGLLMPPVVPVRNADGSYNYSNPYEYAYFAIGDKAANAVSDLENSVAQSINSYLLSNVWAQASHAGSWPGWPSGSAASR